ncbi:MAG: glycosyltransferase [Flavisolibacter sp.]|nr:glycosyltransferase [Flavisolibacter sp.]
MKTNQTNLWSFRKAAPVTRSKKFLLSILIVAGCLSMLHLAEWWFREDHVASVPLFLLLSFIFWWGMIRMIILWISYLGIRVPEKKEAPPGLSVAIFTTSSPGEPLSMFEKTLAACARITYPHTTYLLDDTQDPRFKEAAVKNGAVWLEIVGFPGAKAGKINEALKSTTEDFILVLDPDHIPFPNFLDEVLGYFENEKVGYVQVAQAYYNQYRSFTAKGAAEQTYSFYGPTQIGMHGYNCSVAIGANCTFRRTALESIGGHGIGLAEDLITAIRIHSEGWKSIYAPVVVSRGLVPEDLGSFFKQQLKWARGVHEVLFAELPRLWSKLSFWQKLSYLTIGTYYFSGVTIMLFLLIPFLFLWFGMLPANMDFIQFVLNWLPIAIVGITIYLYVQQWLCHPQNERGLHWRGMFLKFACWPIFFKGFLLSVRNADIPYIPTAKQAVKGFTPFIRPLMIHQLLFIATLFFVVIERRYFTHEAKIALTSGDIWGMVAFACIAFIMTFGGMYAAIESRKIKEEEPWEKIDLELINKKHRKSVRKNYKKMSYNL